MRTKFLIVPFMMLLFVIILTACSPDTDNNENEENNNANNEAGETEDNAEGESESKLNDDEKVEPKQILEEFLNGDHEKMYAQLSEEFQEQIDEDEWKAIGEDIDGDADDFSLVTEMPLNEATTLVWMNEDEEKGATARVDADGVIHGFLAPQPLDTHPETDEDLTETVFSYPFRDEWLAFWGGTNEMVNYHYAQPNQRYAYDFLAVEDNASYSGDPEENESYHAFGKEVLAPADGEVVDVVNDVEDNVPGEMNESEPLGNRVIIDHGEDEYSLLAHFQESSIEVDEGDEVKQGDALGLAGNSGNSSEPHIHFHVADEPSLGDGKSIRIQFENDDDPVQGDILEGIEAQ